MIIQTHTQIWKTDGLEKVLYINLRVHSWCRRDEEITRLKNEFLVLDLKNTFGIQKSDTKFELYNTFKNEGESIRYFVSNWTEIDIWEYIN